MSLMNPWHDVELGDRVVVMRKGAIAQIGSPREVYFAPKDRFVAEFIGAANIVEAPVENGQLVLPGGRLPVAVAGSRRDVVAMIRPETIGIAAADSSPLSGTIDSVSFIGDRLFRTSFTFPSTVPTGIYNVDVYLVRDGKIVDAQSFPLLVNRAGFSADIYNFAHRNGAAYGVIAVLTALLFGWIAHLAFRRR